LYGRSSAFYADSFGSQMCNGFGYGFVSGYPSTPFGFSAFNPISMYGYGQSFWWRGSEYIYSQAGDCYYQRNTYRPFGYRPYWYGWTVAQTPPPPQANPVGRFISVGQIRTPPLTPQPVPMRVAPGGATDVGATQATKMTLAPDNISPQYRTRGLVSHQDPIGVETLAPRIIGPDRRARDASAGTQTSGMVIRGGNDSRSQTNAGNDAAGGRRAPSYRAVDAPSSDAPRATTQRVDAPHYDAPRAAPAPRVESPRVETPRVSSPPPARVESQPARSEPAARSAPAPSPAPAASSSSSSTGKPPGSKN